MTRPIPHEPIPDRSETTSGELTAKFENRQDLFDEEYAEATTGTRIVSWAALCGSLRFIAADAIARVRTLEQENARLTEAYDQLLDEFDGLTEELGRVTA